MIIVNKKSFEISRISFKSAHFSRLEVQWQFPSGQLPSGQLPPMKFPPGQLPLGLLPPRQLSIEILPGQLPPGILHPRGITTELFPLGNCSPGQLPPLD